MHEAHGHTDVLSRVRLEPRERDLPRVADTMADGTSVGRDQWVGAVSIDSPICNVPFVPTIIYKTVDVPVHCECGHAHTHQRREVDWDAYWALDYHGQEDDREYAGWFYAKTAFPNLRDAQRFHREKFDRIHINREEVSGASRRRVKRAS